MKSSMPRVVALFTGGVLLASAIPALAEPGAKPRAPLAIVAPAPALSTARGVVKSVSDTRLAVETGKKGPGAEMVLVLDTGTVVQKLGKAITAKDLKVGDHVTVSYTRKDGRAIAKKVSVRSAHAALGAASGPGASATGR